MFLQANSLMNLVQFRFKFIIRMATLTSTAAGKPSVADFYAGKSVFITGGTGFLGKAFIEKLLHGCPDIDKIYMLIREKKGISINERVSQFLENPLFNRLKETRPADLEKIVLIPGDITVPALGISENHEKILLEKVFTHISTAYTNTNREIVEEILYPPPADIEMVHKLVKDGITVEETQILLDGRPNTYTFTKALTENLVAENQGYLPTIIVRPSIVCSAKDDAIKGWLDNWFGATSIAVLTAKGLNRVIYGEASNIIDLIPVDYVANLVIVASAKNGEEKPDNLKIYNSCSSSCNPLKMEQLMDMFIEDAVKQNSYVMPLPGYMFTKNRWLMTMVTILFQLIPAYLGDGYRRLMGKSPQYVKLHALVSQTQNTVSFFTLRSWKMKADRVRELFASLSPADKHVFPFDPVNINWTEYIRDYCCGVRKFLEKKK